MQSVYALTDPWDALPHYIGRAQDIYKRYAQHLLSPHENAEKNAWMERVKAAGLVPGLLVLEQDIDDEIAPEREMYWICYYLQQDAPLTNINIGQRSTTYYQTEAQPVTAEIVGQGDEELLSAGEAAAYLANKWGRPSYSTTALRMLRHRWNLKPVFLSSKNASFWRKSDLDAIPEPDRHRPRKRRTKQEPQEEEPTA
jgi:hypothetical protein